MKTLVFSLLLFATVGLSSCSVHEIKSDPSSAEAGATIVKIRPVMAWLISGRSELKENGIEKLKGIEVITSADPGLSARYASEIDKEVSKKKMESALKVQEGEEKVDIFVCPDPKRKSVADALVIKVQEPKELTIVKIRGRIDFAKMIANMEKEEDPDQAMSGKKKRLDLGIISID